MDPLTIIAAMGPLAVDLGKGLIGKFLGQDTYKPVNVGEWVQMQATELDKFRAINGAGAEGETYPWVNAIIRLQRPFVAGVALSVWAWAHTFGGGDTAAVDNFAGAVGFYLFGDRTLFHIKRAGVR